MMIVPDFTSSSRRDDFISYPEWQETEYGNMMFLSDGEIRYCGIFETDNEYATNLHCWIGPEGQEVERAVAYVATAITPDIKTRAREKVEEWFGPLADTQLGDLL